MLNYCDLIFSHCYFLIFNILTYCLRFVHDAVMYFNSQDVHFQGERIG